MSERPVYTQQSCETNANALRGEPWREGDWAKGSLTVRVVNNNIRINIFLSHPEEKNKMSGTRPMNSVPVTARMSPEVFRALMERMIEMADSSEPCSEKMACRGRPIDHNTGKPKKDLDIVTVVEYGRSPEGYMFLKVKETERPEFVYRWKANYFHPIKRDMADVEASELSARFCKAWCKNMIDSTCNVMHTNMTQDSDIRLMRQRLMEQDQ